jgi:uncharacterized protein with HEPN domain
MDERIEKWLVDIKFSIQEIEDYFEEVDKSFFEYRKNKMLKRAVERNLEIIGEALNRIVKRDQSYQEKIKNTSSIIGLRNQIIHAYDTISDENI